MSRSYLARRDPTVKAAVVVVISVLLVLVMDPWTPLLFFGGTAVVALSVGRVPAFTLARALAPLAVVALGFAWSNALFSSGGLAFGIALGLRGFAIGALSVTFVRTTDPTDMVVSLIHHARLPFRIGYALLAGYRFLPLATEEYADIRLAQRVRGQLGSSTIGGRAAAALAGIVTLVSSATFRATRIAVAMDARAFGAARERTYFRATPITAADLLFAAIALALAVGLLALSAGLGWLRLWDGRFMAT